MPCWLPHAKFLSSLRVWTRAGFSLGRHLFREQVRAKIVWNSSGSQILPLTPSIEWTQVRPCEEAAILLSARGSQGNSVMFPLLCFSLPILCIWILLSLWFSWFCLKGKYPMPKTHRGSNGFEGEFSVQPSIWYLYIPVCSVSQDFTKYWVKQVK